MIGGKRRGGRNLFLYDENEIFIKILNEWWKLTAERCLYANLTGCHAHFLNKYIRSLNIFPFSKFNIYAVITL